jgi:hypothetical protein
VWNKLIKFEDSTWKNKIMQLKYWKAFSGFSSHKICSFEKDFLKENFNISGKKKKQLRYLDSTNTTHHLPRNHHHHHHNEKNKQNGKKRRKSFYKHPKIIIIKNKNPNLTK